MVSADNRQILEIVKFLDAGYVFIPPTAPSSFLRLPTPRPPPSSCFSLPFLPHPRSSNLRPLLLPPIPLSLPPLPLVHMVAADNRQILEILEFLDAGYVFVHSYSYSYCYAYSDSYSHS